MSIFPELTLFSQLTAILVLAGVLGFFAVKFRQPLIIAFILTGIIAGPDVLHIISEQDREVIETLAGFGIALLLFVVGLKLDLKLIRQMGFMVLVVGIVQISLTFLLGFLLSIFLAFDPVTAAFIGVAMAFSSTIIVVKLLSDRRALDSLYGRFSLGILIVQDLAVILITILITAFAGSNGESVGSAGDLFILLLEGVALIVLTGLFIRYVANPLTAFLAHNSELMVIFCIAFAVFMAVLCEALDFGKELGGLLAGIALASTPYNNIIAARLSALRDFMLLFFFANLGTHMSLGSMGDHIFPALILSVFVLLGKPALIMGIMNLMHYRKRTGFMTGLTLSQISEFSLILMVMGLGAGIVSRDAVNLVMLVGLITMGLSTYAIIYSSRLYAFIENKSFLFKGIKPRHREEKENDEEHKEYDIIIFGLGRYGNAMAKIFTKQGFEVLGVDFDPEVIANARKTGVSAIYGDAADPELPLHIPLKNTKIIVFSFHHYMTGPLIVDLRRTLAKSLREHGYKGRIAATSHHPEHDLDLSDHGIDIVLSPFEDAAFHATEQIVEALGKD